MLSPFPPGPLPARRLIGHRLTGRRVGPYGPYGFRLRFQPVGLTGRRVEPTARREAEIISRSETNMIVGTGLITLRLHDCRSLKGKRKVVKSMISRLRNTFNISAAEVGSNDIYQKAEIGFSLVGNDSSLINSKIDKIFNMAENLGLAEIIETEMEIIHL